MVKNNLGYACISNAINIGKRNSEKITVNRGMIKRTFQSRGLDYVSELSILNLKDFLKILRFNKTNGIMVYRMSSDMFPWFTEYDIEELPKFELIKKLLESAGEYVKENGMRVSFHPGPFCVLSSSNDKVVNKTIDELNKHAHIMDLMGLDKTDFYPINIHLSTSKPTKEMESKILPKIEFF